MIKWIGQHIVSLIARFRDDVYLENLAETTQDHVVGIDSDGKLYKQDRGITDSFTVEDGDTTDVVISNGKHWKFVEGGGIDINWTDTSDGTSSDEYDLTFTLSKNLQDLLIDASHSIRGVAGSDVLVQSAQDINLVLDYDQASTAGTHSFKITNGDGNTIFSVDEDGNVITRGSITAQTTGGATKHPSKGSSGNLLVDDAGVVSTRPVSDLKTDLALAKADVGLGSVENKSSATIRGEIVDSDIPALNASKVTGGTFDDARIPNLGASKVTSGTFDAARIPTLNQDTTGNATTATNLVASTSTAVQLGTIELGHASDTTLARSAAGTVTIEGNQVVTKADFCNQIFSFTFSDLSYVSNTWTTPSQHGPTFYSWNNRHGSGQTQAASDAPSAVDIETTISVDYLDQGAGIVIPVASKFVGFYGNARTNNTTPTSARPVFAIFRAAEPANDNTADITATCIAFDSYDTATGNRKNRFMKLENFPGTPVDLAQGDILFPAIGLDETMSNNTGDILGSFTIVLRTLIP